MFTLVINILQTVKIKTMKQVRCIFYLSIILLSMSCSKNATELTKTDLISRTWQVDELVGQQGAVTLTIYKKGTANNVTDYAKFRLDFNSNGIVTATDEIGKTSQSTWKFINNETQLEIKGDATNPTQTASIVKLTSSNLDFAITQVSQGANIVVTFKMIPL